MSKGDKGKSGKGKTKGKRGDTGKGNPQAKPEEDTSNLSDQKNEELMKQEPKPKELVFESKNELSEFEKLVIKALKDKQRLKEAQSSTNDLESIIDTLKYYSNKRIKAIQLNKVSKTEKRDGLVDSGATRNVRELKVNEDYRGLFPIEVEVAFNSEVKIEKGNDHRT